MVVLQSIGLYHSFKKSGQAGPITRLVSCSPEQKAAYQDIDVGVPTHFAPSWSTHPVTGDQYRSAFSPLDTFLTQDTTNKGLKWLRWSILFSSVSYAPTAPNSHKEIPSPFSKVSLWVRLWKKASDLWAVLSIKVVLQLLSTRHLHSYRDYWLGLFIFAFSPDKLRLSDSLCLCWNLPKQLVLVCQNK